MNAVPAKVAGVPRIALVVPSPDGVLNPLVLAAARLAGVDEVYRVGGAQAVAALAYGTESIPPVAKIVGPGNAYVAAAKRLVFGTVGIDMIAGPSEVLVIADGDNDPAWIAADLLAQAEHDTAAQSILVTNSPALADAVEAAVAAPARDAAPRRDRRRELARPRGGDPRRRPRRRRRPRQPHRAGASRAGGRRSGGAALRRSAMPARSSSAATRRRRSATMSAGRTMSCRRPARRASRPACRCSTSSSARRSSASGRTSSGRSAGPAITLAEAEGLDAHARSVAIRLNR